MTNQHRDHPLNLETIVRISADSIAQLRRCDVYRVLDCAMDLGAFGAMADYITKHRPELKAEVDAVEAELKG